MSKETLMELTQIIAKRYLKAISKKDKTKILDEFCANSWLNRKYTITKIRDICFKNKDIWSDKRWRKKLYSNGLNVLIIEIWKMYDYICWERLHPVLMEWFEILKRFWYLQKLIKSEWLIESVLKKELYDVSLSTVKRRISDYKKRNDFYWNWSWLSSTKPWALLKREIPIKLNQWNEASPWYCEFDLVAHCWWSLLGQLIYTLQAVCIKTTWTERKAVMGKAQWRVFEAIKDIRVQLPFDLLWFDSDNWSEFINHQLIKYCEDNNIQFTRSRPYHSKDWAHIEQKNYTLVRKILWYGRFDTDELLNQINNLYDNELRLYINFFQPTLKMVEKVRVWSKYKRKYDEAKSPYKRVLECKEIPSKVKERLTEVYLKLDPIKLKKEIDKKVMNIVRLWK